MFAILKRSLRGVAYVLSIFLSFSLITLVLVTLVQSLALLLLVCIFAVLILPRQLAENIENLKNEVGTLLQSVVSFVENTLAMLHKNKYAGMDEPNVEAGMDIDIEVDLDQEEKIFRAYMAEKEMRNKNESSKNESSKNESNKNKSEKAAEKKLEKETLKQSRSEKKVEKKESKKKN